MAFTIGIDAEIGIDGNGYWVKPKSYKMQQPRIRKATVRADGGQAYVDLGPGRRVWSMTILCLNEQLKYDGTPTGLTGQQYRDALRASYVSSVGATIQFVDPLNGLAVTVHFDSYAELVYDLRVQQVALATGAPSGLSYEVEIVLVEA
ncbi:MAG: hypothetical protein ACRDHW_06745 [Ktedonobacteraceae bacterium]